MYSKQTNSKGVYSWNKMWSLKNLVMLNCESSLHAVQFLIILKVASLGTSFSCSVGQQAWLYS